MAYEKQHQYSIFEWMFKDNLDTGHELIRLGGSINWDSVTLKLSRYYSLIGRKSKKIRLMVGLHILKHRYDLSDEMVVQGLHENIYWMAFCGVPFEKVNPAEPMNWIEPSTMTKFRERIGAEGFKIIEEIIREQLKTSGYIDKRICITDTTCMEKNIVYPTDIGLLNRGRMKIIGVFKRLKGSGIKINGNIRSFVRVGKKAVIEANKFGKDKAERIQESIKRLIHYAEEVTKHVPQVIKECTRHCVKEANRTIRRRIKRIMPLLKTYTERVKAVVRQSRSRLSGVHIKDKIYSLHEPEVVCIRKGKRDKPNEYGSKVGLQVDKNYYIIGHEEYKDNRHDSETLKEGIENWKHVFNKAPEGLAGDRGFHKGDGDKIFGIKRVSIPRTGKKKGEDENKRWFKRMQRMRAGIEAVISHLKTDHRMNRSRYKGFDGDRINVSLAVLAWNLKKWAYDTA